MRVDLHVHIHSDPGTEQKLDRILEALNALVRQEKTVMADLKSLSDQVKANTDVEASAVTLIQGIAAQLAAAKTDPAQIQALSDQLKNSADSLAAAITANTPAAE